MVWAGDKARGIPGEWDHMKGGQQERLEGRQKIMNEFDHLERFRDMIAENQPNPTRRKRRPQGQMPQLMQALLQLQQEIEGMFR
jgi:hypothetical protein